MHPKLLVAASALTLVAATAGHAAPYDATLIRQSGTKTVPIRVITDGHRYRVAYYLSGLSAPPARVDLYDGNAQLLSWTLDTLTLRAAPSPQATMAAFSKEAIRLGTAKARAKYGVPSVFPVTAVPTTLSPPVSLVTMSQLEDMTAGAKLQSIGGATLAGYHCTIMQARLDPRELLWKQHSGPGYTAVEGNPIQQITAWVEPRHNLVLKMESILSFPMQPSMGPLTSGYEVTALQFPTAIPAATFALPKGTHALIAPIFAGTKLPAGVTPVIRPTAGALGIGFPPLPPPPLGGPQP